MKISIKKDDKLLRIYSEIQKRNYAILMSLKVRKSRVKAKQITNMKMGPEKTNRMVLGSRKDYFELSLQGQRL